mmetsp:Transcript_46846/g.101754  ORF Transcript_46846/g.101754 Transcript_46846/m.101754 type:complete len:267 (-) Transcript_46846:377-1177(-)
MSSEQCRPLALHSRAFVDRGRTQLWLVDPQLWLAFQGAKDSVGGSRLCRRSSHRFLKQRSRNGSPRQVSTRMLSASKVEVPVRLRHDGRVELPEVGRRLGPGVEQPAMPAAACVAPTAHREGHFQRPHGVRVRVHAKLRLIKRRGCPETSTITARAGHAPVACVAREGGVDALGQVGRRAGACALQPLAVRHAPQNVVGRIRRRHFKLLVVPCGAAHVEEDFKVVIMVRRAHVVAARVGCDEGLAQLRADVQKVRIPPDLCSSLQI